MDRIVLVQHCQSAHHLDRSAGTDSELTDLGRKQASCVAERIAAELGGAACRLVSSDLKRAWQTAEINLPAHRIPALKKLLRQAGARLLPLPPYSPDLSPMEPAWSKIKQYLRSVKPRTGKALRRTAAKAFTTITAEDAKGWFPLCGYRVR